MIKKPVNFRLSKEANVILITLTEKLHLSKTEILERALLRYAESQLKESNELLKYAGCISDDVANEMLLFIKSHRHNKRMKKL